MRVPIFLIGLAFFPSLNAQAANARSGHIILVMVFWLSRPGNVYDQNVLLRRLRTLRRVRGVSDMRTDCSFPIGQPRLQQSFDVGAVVRFRGRDAPEEFERDPQPGGAPGAILQQLVRRYDIFNFANE